MTTNPGDLRWDMYDRELYASPYGAYRGLREEAPLYYNEQYGFYAVSRFEDVRNVLVDRDTRARSPWRSTARMSRRGAS